MPGCHEDGVSDIPQQAAEPLTCNVETVIATERKGSRFDLGFNVDREPHLKKERDPCFNDLASTQRSLCPLWFQNKSRISDIESWFPSTFLHSQGGKQ